MTTSLKWLATFAVATAVSLAPLASNAADDANDGPSTRVKIYDLDLAKPADVQTLYERVRAAAADVCAAEVARYRRSTRKMAPLGWRERCVSDAIDAAVRDVGNRRLATLHDSGTRGLL